VKTLTWVATGAGGGTVALGIGIGTGIVPLGTLTADEQAAVGIVLAIAGGFVVWLGQAWKEVEK